PTNVSSTPEPEVWRVQLSQPVPKLYVDLAIETSGYQSLIPESEVSRLYAANRTLSVLGISPLEELGLEREDAPPLDVSDVDPRELREAIRQAEARPPQSERALLSTLVKLHGLTLGFMTSNPNAFHMDKLRMLKLQLAARILLLSYK
ncbi:hypothetical protein, partial [Burkholderia ubonensis]|uniref:hypothetical protein n=1 Tax=Burkholderia ubonensis TaxID=101571 RepID=UPI001E2CE72D